MSTYHNAPTVDVVFWLKYAKLPFFPTPASVRYLSLKIAEIGLRRTFHGRSIPVIAGVFLGGFCPAANCQPWRLGDAVAAPAWLTIDGSYRIRYEHLDNPFRLASDGTEDLLVERLLLGMRADHGPAYAGLEIEDSRAQLGDARPPLGTDDVNALEPLQAYVGLRMSDVFAKGDQLDFVGGRLTIDAGSRRLAARNRFRNTLNAFTGVHARWLGETGSTLQLFYTFPVNRLPFSLTRLDNNDQELDESSNDVRFWGMLASREHIFGNAHGEMYVFGLNESDAPDLPTADRDLYTPGARLVVSPAPGAWDFEIEAALQFGTSRQSLLPSDTTGLDHRAGFVHLHAGRTFEAIWEPRVVLQYDYASGDSSPDDDENNRFDTLYGARRFDFGPTGIYGAFARSNISSPGLRLDTHPGEHTTFLAGYRAVYLASRRDALTTAGLRDPAGASGNFVGQQLEFLFQYEAVPDNVDVELGGAWLIDGEFLRDAPGAPENGDAFYWYAQVGLTF